MAAVEYHNPFRPTAGAEPPRIIGRDEIVLEFSEGLRAGVGAPARLMRITGPRGSGKTVLLCDLRERAAEQGWKTAMVAATPRLLEDLEDQIFDSSLIDSASLGLNIGVASAKVNMTSNMGSLRTRLKAVAQENRGLFIAIDEVQDAPIEAMRTIATTVQLLIGEKVNIALAFAGLPAGVMDLINGDALTFLRRALPESLTTINQVEVAISMRDSFAESGLILDGEPLEMAARATKGYAYLIQLVGYSVWQRANLNRGKHAAVSREDVEIGIALAEARFHDVVHEPAIAGLNLQDIRYLLAMCEDKRVSKSSEIAKRLGKKTSEISSTRAKLLQREVIQAPQRGYVEFAVPDLDEYLRQNKEEILERY